MSRGLARRHHSVRVVTAHPHYPEWAIAPGYGQWSRTEELGGVRVDRLLHYVPSEPSLVPRTASELSFGIRQIMTRWGAPDSIVAVSPGLLSSALARLRAKITHRRTPFVVWVQDLYGLGTRETGQAAGVALRAVVSIERWLLRSASQVVVIHDRFADRVHVDFGVPRDRITVVRNWTHIPPMEEISAEGMKSARAKFGWSESDIIVLHTGNMGVKQGLHHVVSAARLAHEQRERIRFVLIGNGSQRDELVRLADAAPANVQFIAPLGDDDFADALRSADVLLVNELPGVAEMAVPSKLTSYFAAARPVLAATDVGGITAQEVASAGAGVVVRAGDPEALIEGARLLTSDADAAVEMGRAGRRYRETVLDETFAIDSFDSLLRDLADRG